MAATPDLTIPWSVKYGSLTLLSLTVLFTSLKLSGVIAWGWWAVLLPSLPVLFAFILALVFIGCMVS